MNRRSTYIAPTLELTDTDALILETLEFEPSCQGIYHEAGSWGHAPSECARWMVAAPCGQVLLLCDSWVRDTFSGEWATVDCSCEKGQHRTAAMSVSPIGGGL